MCRKRWEKLLKRVNTCELQHGVMSAVNAQLEVVARTLQSASQQTAGGCPGGAALQLQPFPTSSDIPTSQVREDIQGHGRLQPEAHPFLCLSCARTEIVTSYIATSSS